MGSAVAKFRDLRLNEKTVFVCMALIALLSVANAFAYGQAHSLIEQGKFDQLPKVDELFTAIAIPHIVVTIFSIITFFRWLYMAHKNLPAIGADMLPISPGWAVGYFFIPVVNLVKPAHAMSQLWRASANPHNWSQQPQGGVVALWWGVLLITSILGNIGDKMVELSSEIETTKFGLVLCMLSNGAMVVTCIVQAMMVHQITQMQLVAANKSKPDAADHFGEFAMSASDDEDRLSLQNI